MLLCMAAPASLPSLGIPRCVILQHPAPPPPPTHTHPPTPSPTPAHPPPPPPPHTHTFPAYLHPPHDCLLCPCPPAGLVELLPQHPVLLSKGLVGLRGLGQATQQLKLLTRQLIYVGLQAATMGWEGVAIVVGVRVWEGGLTCSLRGLGQATQQLKLLTRQLVYVGLQAAVVIQQQSTAGANNQRGQAGNVGKVAVKRCALHWHGARQCPHPSH